MTYINVCMPLCIYDCESCVCIISNFKEDLLLPSCLFKYSNTNYDCQHDWHLSLHFVINLYIAREECTQARMLCIAQELFVRHDSTQGL